ncbi:MAG TPA: FliH/SctL family protein [Acidimicrobiales bacterium]|nr:FliH/SctL family protein [Acidimicrobiales bacterium]
MSSSCDVFRSARVLRGVRAEQAALPDIPVPVAAVPRDTEADRAAALEAELRAGFQAGYEEGLRAAHDEMAAQHAALAARAAALLRSLGAAAAALEARTLAELGSVEDAIVAGAIELAEAVLGRELAGDRAAADAVARALALAPRNVEVTVYVHPGDLAVLDASGVPANVTLAADAGLAPGGCTAEVGDCTIDARIPEALDRARAAAGIEDAR